MSCAATRLAHSVYTSRQFTSMRLPMRKYSSATSPQIPVCEVMPPVYTHSNHPPRSHTHTRTGPQMHIPNTLTHPPAPGDCAHGGRVLRSNASCPLRLHLKTVSKSHRQRNIPANPRERGHMPHACLTFAPTHIAQPPTFINTHARTLPPAPGDCARCGRAVRSNASCALCLHLQTLSKLHRQRNIPATSP